VISSTPRPYFTLGKDPVLILQEAGLAPGPVWTGGKSRPHRDSIPDRPSHSSVAIPTELPGSHKMKNCNGKGTGKVHRRTGHENPEGVYRYSSILSLTSALDEEGGQRHASIALPPGKTRGLRTGQDGCGKSRPQRYSIPGPSSL